MCIRQNRPANGVCGFWDSDRLYLYPTALPEAGGVDADAPKILHVALAACMLKFVTTPRHHVGPESEGPAPAKSRLSNHQMYQSVNATSRAFCRDMFRCQTAAAEAGCLKVYYSGLNNYQYYFGGSVLESQYNVSQNPILF